NARLLQTDRYKDAFLAAMGHEFRTPLNAILGYTSMLLQGVSGTLNPGQRKALARVDSNGRHLLQVINEILDITRIEAGRMPLNLSDFRLPELFREVIAELEPIMSRSPVPVVIEVRDDVPPVRGDRQKTKQIVVNLLSNALKFTHQGSIRIEARTLRGRRNIAIAVRDTGIGIAPEYHRMIFEDFKQVDNSPTRAYGGTGLGLAICRRLASMLGGRITLESALGMGSAFTLHIPRKAKR
ncbi:MAG: histidine kinase, partial [Myxococcales bacterium]|nr:histidine kinase [Myxococcales bacterium]